MFGKKNLGKLRRNVNSIDKEQERRKKAKEKRRDNVTYSHDEVTKIVENHTLLGCRFGIYILFQIQNQKSLKVLLKDVLTDQVGVDEEDIAEDSDLLRVLMQKDVHEVIGKTIHQIVMDQYINDEHVNHAQAVLAQHGEQDISELVGAVMSFSDQVDKHYEEHKDESPLSPTIN